MISTDRDVHHGKEHEPGMKVNIAVYGFAHDPLNLQGNRGIIETAERYLSQTNGNVFLLIENTVTPQIARGMAADQREHGLWYPQLHGDLKDLLGRPPTEAFVRNRMEELRNAGAQEILDKELLLGGDIRINLMLRDIAALQARNPRLKTREETHSERVINAIKPHKQKYRSLEEQIPQLWEAGAYDEACKALETIFLTVGPSRKERDREIVSDNIKPLVEGLLKDSRGGAVIALMGANHVDGIMAGTRWAFGKRIGYQPIVDVPPNLAQLQTKVHVTNGQPIPRELVAQGLFESILLATVEDIFVQNSVVDIYANNFNAVYQAICNIAQETPEEKVRELCEQQADIGSFFMEHPLSDSLDVLFAE